MKYRILSKTDRELFQADVMAIVDYTDLAALANGNTGSFKVAPYTGGDAVTQPFSSTTSAATIPAGVIVSLKCAILDTAFVFSDASIISAAAIIGDAGSTNRYMASTETASAGTSVPYSVGTGTRFTFTTADDVVLAFTGTSAHNLNTATAGQLRMFFKLEDTAQLPTS